MKFEIPVTRKYNFTGKHKPLKLVIQHQMETGQAFRKFSTTALLISIFITMAIGFTAALITKSQITGWYATLNKPSFSPPNWLFAPVWTSLYIMMAVSAYLVWQKRDNSTNYLTARSVYIIQLVLNFLWSMLFFGLHSVVGGLLVIILLWMMILVNVRWFGKLSKWASLLLLPYFLWVSFAAILNYFIFTLNRPA